MAIRTMYLKTIFDPELFPKTVEKTVKRCLELKETHNFDSIAFSGMSGAAMAFIVAARLGVPLICIRKKSESSHFFTDSMDPNNVLEGNIDSRRYIIVDDFISSGRTVNYIMDSIEAGMPAAKCMGMVMYASHGSDYDYQRNLDSGPKWRVLTARPENT